MKPLICVAALAVILASCGPKAEKTEAAVEAPVAAGVAALPDPAGACAAKVSYDWVLASGAKYTITGASAGATCDSGEAVITIRNAATGKVLLSQGGYDVAVMTNTVFADAKTPNALKLALAGWITPQDPTETTATFPVWTAGQPQPSSGEFPFYPEEGLTQGAYAALRAANQPAYCHVQGGESLACYELDTATDTLKKVGLQTFPG